MMSESRVETLNVLAPLCKKLQAITHHTAASQAKKRNREPYSPAEKSLLSVFLSETSVRQSSPPSRPFLMLPHSALNRTLN